MSTIMYARLTNETKAQPRFQLEEGKPETPDQKLAKVTQAVTALVPAEVLAIHAAVLAYATVVGNDGTTSVTKPEVLKWSLPVLAAVATLLFVIGHRGKWKRPDLGRALVPAIAFAAWTLLTGTSAATPWLEDVDRGWILLIGGAVAALVVALSFRLTPKAPAGA